MLDFDKIFENYLVEWYKNHESEYGSVEEMEDALPGIYNEWADTASSQLGGIAPRAFFQNITSPTELIKIMIGTSNEELNPCSLLIDRIAEVSECSAGLKKIIAGAYSVKQKMLAVNLLRDMDTVQPFEEYISWLEDCEQDPGLKELAVEILSENADAVSGKLFEILPEAGFSAKTDIAEILIKAKPDERTFGLLTELFDSGRNLPLFAGYLGKYGDERSAARLYKALDDCNYLEYIEIKNAIERLGGVVEDTRDFSDDIYYKAIKNLK